MLTQERRRQIAEYVREHGLGEVSDLAERFGVSAMTIRRDLEALAGAGLLRRTWGGAVANVLREETLAKKETELQEEKRRIAAAAAELVNPGDTIVLDAGSTTAAMVPFLAAKMPLTVVTPDLHIAIALADIKGCTVLIPPGVVQPGLYTLIGGDTAAYLNSLNAARAFLGASAVDVKAGVTTPTPDKAPVKRAIVKAAAATVLVADASKFGRRALLPICRLNELDAIITDSGVDAELAAAMRANGAKLTIV